jgi:hypothetical protein
LILPAAGSPRITKCKLFSNRQSDAQAPKDFSIWSSICALILVDAQFGNRTLPQVDAEPPVRKLLSPILVPDNPVHRTSAKEETAMVQTRIKPHFQQVAEKARRAEQTRVYRRNQVLGLVLLAAAVLLWWLFHTNPKWIFPPGWWRP